MELNILPQSDKKDVFKTVKEFLESNHFKIIKSDENRPWGGFYVIDELQSEQFINFFFLNVIEAKQKSTGKISPKILIVEGHKRLSWQYHHRRSEIWKVIGGEVGVIKSDTDKEGNLQLKKKEDIIILKQGERHRLIGTENWGIIAEIWQHTDTNKPSDEDDIVRVQDDFGR
ncbi:MAG: phosphoheptose isomerase [Bacteroidota bacterium]|nr:phosphoheptose isomerase [Bacteroidota bacterium]